MQTVSPPIPYKNLPVKNKPLLTMLGYTAIIQKVVPIKFIKPQTNYKIFGPYESNITLNMIKAKIVGILTNKYEVETISSPNIGYNKFDKAFTEALKYNYGTTIIQSKNIYHNCFPVEYLIISFY